jgi:TPR repeat protein
MRFSTLVALAVLVAGAVPVSAQSVKAGIDAWQRGDYAGADAIWRPLAEAGDADAAFNLGQAYRLGRGVPTNLGAAQAWFERAARKGHVDAQTTLGLMLFQNGNQTGGLRWLKEAAEQGEPRALLVYGTALFNGDGIPRDPVLGYAYVSRAAAQGLAPAKDTLAQLDQLLPVDQRQKAVAIAIAKAKQAPPPASKPRKAADAKPAPAPAKVAPVKQAQAKPAAPSPASGAWKIQLGAFNSRAAAEATYRKLAGNSALSGRTPQYIPFNQFVRLRAGPYASREAASAACSALKVPCFAVAPGK